MVLFGLVKKLAFGGLLTWVWDEMIRPPLVESRVAERAAARGDTRPVLVVTGPVEHELPHADGSFSAVILNNAVERSEDPIAAVLEAARVGERVVVLAPPWWAAHAWIDPRNKWFVTRENAYPLYNSKAWNRPVELPPDLSHGATSWKRWLVNDMLAPSWGDPLPYTEGQASELPPHPDLPTWA